MEGELELDSDGNIKASQVDSVESMEVLGEQTVMSVVMSTPDVISTDDVMMMSQNDDLRARNSTDMNTGVEMSSESMMSVCDKMERTEPMSTTMSMPVYQDTMTGHEQMSYIDSPLQNNIVGNDNEPPELQNFSRIHTEDELNGERDYTPMEGQAHKQNDEQYSHREPQPTHPHPPTSNKGDVHYHYHYHYCCGHNNNNAERNGNWGRPPDGVWHPGAGVEQHQTRPGRSDQNELRATVIRWRGA